MYVNTSGISKIINLQTKTNIIDFVKLIVIYLYILIILFNFNTKISKLIISLSKTTNILIKHNVRK